MLKEFIIEKIKREGPITFENFMELCLYHPEQGYYMRADAKIGRDGDFYTAPHLHRAFGAAVMRQIEECWNIMERLEDFVILEIGGGMGYLANDILDYAEGREIYSKLKYYLIELNSSLKRKQKDILYKHLDKIRWFNSVSDIVPFKGCILSNELFDSFPVHIIESTENGIKEIYVNTDGEDFFEIKGELSDGIEEYIRDFSINLPEGFRTEVNLRIKEWLRIISGILIEGFLITIDYGYPAWQYYGEDYPQGTLQCYYRHLKSDNPYIHIGEQDITSHVNFSSLKKWGEELGFKSIGYTSQGRFIVSMGIDEIINELIKPEDYSFEIPKLKSLIMPEGMGESHKVMIQYKGKGNPQLRGFRLRNELLKL
ncbi:MAG: SAM-dependent methyltransferase [Thermodesulfovibrionales bacterium]|nr:SAM-dependent methyltransferase [Thermodesulfovibrionales bacterium]